MAIKKSHLALLEPFLVGERPREDGEWDMHCPLHQDRKRSAQLNVETGLWYCHAGCGGGKVADLVRKRSAWVKPSDAARNGSARPSRSSGRPKEPITDVKINAWHEALMDNQTALDEIMEARGLSRRTLRRYEIGWDAGQRAYTIPVRDSVGEIWNVRRYQVNARSDRRKIWSVEGMGQPRLYPLSILDDDPERVIICEGEMDALRTIQEGYPAITRTGAAGVWKNSWGRVFKGKVVYLCHDMDKAGQEANRSVGEAIKRVAREVRLVQLPYEITDKHGKDLSDFWEEYGKRDFRKLLRSAALLNGEEAEPEELDPSDATVLDSFDSRKVGQPLKVTVTIKGKREPGYSVPRTVHYNCSQDAGDKCAICPMNLVPGGDDTVVIEARDPVVLEIMEATLAQRTDILRRHYGTPKCGKLSIEPQDWQGVEVLYARPSVDHVQGSEAGDYKTMKVTNVGKHDTAPNQTVEVTGSLQPDPRKHSNEFQSWDLTPLETSLDHFQLGRKEIGLMSRFQPRPGQRPLKRLGQIARELEAQVTRIYGRPEMHAVMDLVWHSALSFKFGGKLIERGWLDALVVGDTRTGKSEAATRLARHYGTGEVISCEAASFAGIIGGLQQYGSNKEWSITWGVVPLNDRRLVVLDEVSGLQPEEIAAMSDVRSRGMAQLTKIQQEQTHARTRLLWLGNPRNRRMTDYTYGVQAIKPLIGNAEDVARFDLAMSVTAGEVPLAEINRSREDRRPAFPPDAYHALVRWAWSRAADQIVWASGAEDSVYEAAQAMALRYTEEPPLVQGANVREKIARLSVALAARLFSHKSPEEILVTRAHVEDAVEFMDHLYGMVGFGYRERSKQVLGDVGEAEGHREDIKQYLYNKPGLVRLLRTRGTFERQNVEETMNVSLEEANAVIAVLWDARMVRIEDNREVRVEPVLHQLLREINI